MEASLGEKIEKKKNIFVHTEGTIVKRVEAKSFRLFTHKDRAFYERILVAVAQ